MFAVAVIPAALNSEAGQAGLLTAKLVAHSLLVIPAKAGIQLLPLLVIPAKAGLSTAAWLVIHFDLALLFCT
jgi:hypothetical protein